MEVESFSKYCQSFLLNPESGSEIFFQDKNSTYTYQQLIESALCRAHYFLNSPDVFFALKIESSYKLFTHLLGAIIAQKNVLVISSKEPVNSIARLQDNIPFTVVLNDHDPEIPYRDFTFPDIEINSRRPAFFILSSGSSGPAKGIPLSLENIYQSAKSVIDFFQMNFNDISFSNLPHHHIGGLMIFWRAFFSMSRVSTDERLPYDFISLVPLQFQRLLNDNDKLQKLSKCRGVLIGGAPLDDHLKAEALKYKVPVYETYGMSETSSLVMLNGRPLPGQSIKLDSEGYFLLKGKTLTESVPVDSEGYYHTKDMGVVNPDGTLSFIQRGDLLFKSAGEMVNPLLLEAKLKELTWIIEAVVVPVNHSEWTQAGVAIYKSSDASKNADDLKEFLKLHFHPYQIPKFFMEAPKDLIHEGIKPRRFDISQFAQAAYFKEIIHHLYIPNPSSKKLMVFFHGFMEDHTDMIPLMDSHKETSFLFIDLPGHGRTKTSNFKSRNNVFQEILSMIRFYNKEKLLSLYGYSMGGRIALELTLMGLHPENLILESSHFGLAESEKAPRLASDKKLLAQSNIDLKQFFTDWYKNPIFSNYNQSSHYKIDVEKKLSHDPSEWQASLNWFSPGAFPFDLKTVEEKLLTQKITGIIGVEDSKYKNHFEEMRPKLKDMSIYEIENCGHNPHKTHLSEVKKILALID